MPTVLIKESTIDAIMYTLEKQGCKLEYAVDEYPLVWNQLHRITQATVRTALGVFLVVNSCNSCYNI